MSRVAFWRLKPKSFWKTSVTYDMRLIGSFQTITIQGRSYSRSSSETGCSTSTSAGAIRVLMGRIVANSGRCGLGGRRLLEHELSVTHEIGRASCRDRVYV